MQNLLVDSGSAISFLHLNVLADDVKLNVLDHPLMVEGVGGGRLEIKYWVNLKLTKTINFDFFVAPPVDNFCEDGLLGCDFLEKFNSVIDFKKNTLSVGTSTFKLKVKVEAILNLREKSTLIVDHSVTEENLNSSSQKELRSPSKIISSLPSKDKLIEASDAFKVKSRKKSDKKKATKAVGNEKFHSFSGKICNESSLNESSAESSDESECVSDVMLSSDSAQSESGT